MIFFSLPDYKTNKLSKLCESITYLARSLYISHMRTVRYQPIFHTLYFMQHRANEIKKKFFFQDSSLVSLEIKKNSSNNNKWLNLELLLFFVSLTTELLINMRRNHWIIQ